MYTNIICQYWHLGTDVNIGYASRHNLAHNTSSDLHHYGLNVASDTELPLSSHLPKVPSSLSPSQLPTYQSWCTWLQDFYQQLLIYPLLRRTQCLIKTYTMTPHCATVDSKHQKSTIIWMSDSHYMIRIHRTSDRKYASSYDNWRLGSTCKLCVIVRPWLPSWAVCTRMDIRNVPIWPTTPLWPGAFLAWFEWSLD